MSNLRIKQWKAAKCMKGSKKNWSSFDVIGIDIAEPQIIIFLLGVYRCVSLNHFLPSMVKLKLWGNSERIV